MNIVVIGLPLRLAMRILVLFLRCYSKPWELSDSVAYGAITKLGFHDGWTNDTSESCKNWTNELGRKLL